MSDDAALTMGRLTYLSNQQAAMFLNLSPRTLEKYRVIGGGPIFRKFGRRVVYARTDLEAWAGLRACDSTSDPAFRRAVGHEIKS